MTQVAARNESDAMSNLVYGVSDTRSETQVIVIRKEAVTQCHHFSSPTVAQEKVKRDRRAVIEILFGKRREFELLRSSDFSDCVEQFFIDCQAEVSFGRVEA